MFKVLVFVLSISSAVPVFAADRAQGTAVLDREAFLARANTFAFDSFDGMAPGTYPNGTERDIDGITYTIDASSMYNTFSIDRDAAGGYIQEPYVKDALYFSPTSPGVNAFGFTVPPTTGNCYCMNISFTDIKGRSAGFDVYGFSSPISFIGVISAEPISSIRLSHFQVNDLYFASVSIVPEPTGLWMLVLGLLSIAKMAPSKRWQVMCL